MNTVHDFARCRTEGRRISIVTAYDAWSARVAARSNVDAILVGDSAAMVIHGHPTTVSATVKLMAMHTRAVVGAAQGKLVIADLPFLSFRKGTAAAMRAVEALVTSGAQAVKLEGVDGHERVIERIIGSGVPVMGHVGLTPQSVHAFGGFRVQGRGDAAAERLVCQARRLAALGCFAIVLECVPAALAQRITADVDVPTIGIGAGAGTTGQVLVLHDLCGLSGQNVPRFVRQYVAGERLFVEAVNEYAADVSEGRFPAAEESYT
jgi:3-methyl-2-oxobutanoate hydroxymethyltransferase